MMIVQYVSKNLYYKLRLYFRYISIGYEIYQRIHALWILCNNLNNLLYEGRFEADLPVEPAIGDKVSK